MPTTPDGRPVVPSRSALRPLGLHEVRLTGGFWGQRQQVNARATLDHSRTWLDKMGWTGNFTAGHATRAAERRGREFSDSEVYKFVEALSWETGRPGGEDREAEIAELTAAFAEAQSPDGYLNTAFGGPGQRPRYSDLNFGHELYCAGHLLQAGVARARTRGADPLVDVVRGVADHVCATFSADGLPGICGHPEIEPALVELARVTGEQRYLDQAALFVERRGHRTLPEHEFGWGYFLDDVPVRSAPVLRGHAVRALYLSMGAVDVAVETGDTELLEAVTAQFSRALARRTYLTGGVGSRHLDESFGDDFVLPPDRSYSETCAGVATIMLAWRLLLATGEPRYADIIERVLFNVIATAIADDGRSFFYAHTLHQRVPTVPPALDKEQLRFGGGPRAPWFEVSCCLNNVARLLASLSTYLVTADADGLQVHQYADLEARIAGGPGIAVRTDYPDAGEVTVRVTETDGAPWVLTLRVPAWADGASITGPNGRVPVEPGLVRIHHAFAVGEEIRLELPVRPRYTFPDPRIDAVRGCVAVEAGPLVLCAESLDGPDAVDLDAVRVDTSQPPQPDAVNVEVTQPEDSGWPYQQNQPVPGTLASRALPLLPYHRWARRGSSTMRVWIPTAPTQSNAR